MGTIRHLDWLARRCARLRARSARVVLTNGCFDLLHVGHVRYLRTARRLGDCLIVGINGDESVRRLKGPGRPLLPEAERAEVVAALACVDYVVVFQEDTADLLVERLRPDVYVKGADYAPGGGGTPLPETRAVAASGGRVELVPLVPGRSTTELVAEILRRCRPESGSSGPASSPGEGLAPARDAEDGATGC